MTMNPYRTHNCGELRAGDIGSQVRIAGWVDTIRDHGGVIFIDLRDHYGITQVVINDDEMLKGLAKEYVLSVPGTLRKRSEDTINPRIGTGEVELKADKLEILSQCVKRLPFDINESTQTREEVRLRYRFLDLRNPEVRQSIALRAGVIKFLRQKMEELGFMEIQTDRKSVV